MLKNIKKFLVSNYKIIVGIGSSLFLCPANAVNSLGSVADNATYFAGGVAQFFVVAACIIGGCFLFAAWVHYDKHKKNPGQFRLTNVVFLALFGILMLLVPVISYMSPSAQTVQT